MSDVEYIEKVYDFTASDHIENKKLYNFGKRAFDIFFSLVSLMLFAPTFIIVIALIRLDSEGSAIFTQNRVGLNGKVFKIFKFRSMYVDAEKRLIDLLSQNEMDGPVFKMSNDPRITRLGSFLRKSSLDELPQLLNILKGDMSFVGPRPPLPDEVERYNSYHKNRLAVTPGLTCYWQISGRNHIGFDEWVEMDIAYIRDRSFMTDLKIILLTVPAVLTRKGAY